MKLSGFITIGKSDVYEKGQGQSWKVMVTKVKTNFASIRVFPRRNSRLNLQMAVKWCKKFEVK